MAKYLLIGAIALSLLTAGIGYKNYMTLTETRETLQSTDTKLKGTESTLAKTTNDLKTTTATLEAAEADKTKLAADLTSKESELATTKGQLDVAAKESADKDAKIADLEKQIADVTVNLPAGSDGGMDLRATIDGLNQQVQDANAQITSLQEKNKSDQAVIAEYKKQEEVRKTKIMQQGLEGRVLAVNPAWNFVVLSIGDKQGVVNNAELLLKRGGQYLGKVRITSVEPSTSIADIVANTMPAGVAVQPGDSVIFQSNAD